MRDKDRTIDIRVHIGLHKTATTLVQTFMRKECIDGHTLFLEPGSNAFSALRNAILSNRKNSRNDRVMREYKKLISEGGFSKVFISDENLIGSPPIPSAGRRKEIPYPTLERQIELMDVVFGEGRLSYVVSVRDAPKWIHSLYSDGLRYMRYSHTFSEYIRMLDVGEFNPDRIVHRVRSVTGNPVDVVPYQLLASEPKNFFKEICEDFDVEKASAFSKNCVNEKLPATHLAVLRQLSPGSIEESRAVREWLKLIPVPPRRIPDLESTDEDLAYLEQFL